MSMSTISREGSGSAVGPRSPPKMIECDSRTAAFTIMTPSAISCRHTSDFLLWTVDCGSSSGSSEQVTSS
ncbi:unnamed protein product [Strongylus vulgaris]|uniref:Uncharacterized protein n=1 Tax=Strongylus vulgaris TaxID=40348 RepID=A0A3P7K197_STRVU|nr:unnamed protein product [Strongylus vulgaris]